MKLRIKNGLRQARRTPRGGHQEVRLRHAISENTPRVDATFVACGFRHLPVWSIGDQLRCVTLVPVLLKAPGSDASPVEGL